MGNLDRLVEDLAPLLARVPPGAALDFRRAGPALWGRVERLLASDQVLAGAGGAGAFGSARKDHRFLTSVLDLRLARLLVQNLPWIYRTARGRGEPADLAPRLFQHWTLAVLETLPPDASEPVAAVLRWVVDHHEDWVGRSGVEPLPIVTGDARWEDLCQAFVPALLEGGQMDCLRLAEAGVRTAADLGAFYAHVLTPALQEVGRRWECGRISVAEEHRASAAARRVCDVLNQMLAPFHHRKGRVVVTASPDEWHDLGARVLADLLAGDGWAVDYLGANVPVRDLASLVRQARPQVLALSLTVPFNLAAVRDLVSQLRAEHGARGPKVMVGGALFGQDPELWRRLGADVHAGTASEALAVLAGWWEARD